MMSPSLPPTPRIRVLAMLPVLVTVLLAVLARSQPIQAQAQRTNRTTFSAKQTEAIENIVRDYILEHPEVILEAVQIYQQRQKVVDEQRQRQAIMTYAAQLQGEPGDPVLGAPNGDVVLVEFFDYRCPYCRGVADMVRQTVREDGNVRLVMKELPVLGPESMELARTALSAHKQDPAKYEAFHMALMTTQGELDHEHVRQLARDIGLDVERLDVDKQDPAIDQVIERSQALAQILGISGTPAFVIGGVLIPGAIDQEHLKRLITEARARPAR